MLLCLFLLRPLLLLRLLLLPCCAALAAAALAVAALAAAALAAAVLAAAALGPVIPNVAPVLASLRPPARHGRQPQEQLFDLCPRHGGHAKFITPSIRFSMTIIRAESWVPVSWCCKRESECPCAVLSCYGGRDALQLLFDTHRSGQTCETLMALHANSSDCCGHGRCRLYNLGRASSPQTRSKLWRTRHLNFERAHEDRNPQRTPATFSAFPCDTACFRGRRSPPYTKYKHQLPNPQHGLAKLRH